MKQSASGAESRGIGFGAKLKGKVREVFGADLRSLAALRIALATLVLTDLLMRARDFRAFYTDDGVVPRSFLFEHLLSDSMFSLAVVGGGVYFEGFLFLLTALAALCMLVGYRTRLSTVVVWVLLISIARRNPLVLNGGDTFIRMLLFWAMFLPLGAYWSVDRALKSRAERARLLDMRFVSVATAALFIQIAFVYIFTAILKSGDEWRVDGTAIYYALNYEQLTKPLGEVLLNYPDFLTVMTFATLALEAIGPFLLFLPFLNGISRLCMVFAFASLHLGIFLTMEIGLFPFVSALAMLCFIPAFFWNGIAGFSGRTFPNASRRTNEAFSRLGYHLRNLGGTLASMRSDLTSARDGDFLGFAAGIRPRTKPGNGRTRSKGAPDTKNTDGKGDTSAEGESRGGDGPPLRLRASRLTNVLAGFFLIYITLWNITTVTDFRLSEGAANLGVTLGINQKWSMFAPHPPTGDVGWFVLPGELENGGDADMMSVVHGDLESPLPVSYEKPESVAKTYENKHWRKYLTGLIGDDAEDQRLYFGQYVCRTWNGSHTGGDVLSSFSMVYVQQTDEGRKANVIWRDFDCS